MNLMERGKTDVQLWQAPQRARDADAPAAPAQGALIRAVLAPYEERAEGRPFGERKARGTQLLYDGTVRLEAGMSAEAGGSMYRLASVRRYPWLQIAELTEETP